MSLESKRWNWNNLNPSDDDDDGDYHEKCLGERGWGGVR